MPLTDGGKNAPLPGGSIDVKYYTFTNLSRFPELGHGVFTRKGGVSKPPFNSMNVGFSSGDSREDVLKNRERIARCMSRGGLLKPMIHVNQVHGKAFAVFKKDADNPLSFDQRNGAIFEADGIVTDIEGVFAVIQVADCQAVILYDPVCKVVANIHSGWRGSILNILGSGVKIMKREFGTDPGNIVAAVSPSLGPCCSEFKHYREEIPRDLWKYQLDNHGNHFDFWQMSLDQLAKEGVKPENIELSRVCTPCDSDTFYSYRKEKVTGRFAVVAGIQTF